ncbi:hypothetical protein RI129_011707 [Pyrocoelia pectoralis]|uniref:Uncharacterized protein n=1 Tax=Pyrocoelia pectoralis TaxID=417401 RepID=A0AAN7Z7W8_9COLE
MKICLLYEVLCTRQGFFICESCRTSLSDCAKKIEYVCNSERSDDVIYKKGCCMCGGEYNIQVFKILKRGMGEKVLRRLKRQYMSNTILTNKICSNCNGMFLELVNIHTLLHDNIKNYENCKDNITKGLLTFSTNSKKIQVGGTSQKGNFESNSSNCNASAQTSSILVNDKQTQIDVNIMNKRAKCRANVTSEKKMIASNNKEHINNKVTSDINQQSSFVHASTQTSLKLPSRVSGRKKSKDMNSVNSKSEAQKEGAPRVHHSEDMNSQLCKKVAFKNPLLPTPPKTKQHAQTSALKYNGTVSVRY